MHGDFNLHNIIVAESDYLNYEYNFPVIFNYVKTILSTNIVVFLGYSFNDPDIKHIINWIDKNSVKRKTFYFITFDDFFYAAETKYLESFGFRIINLSVLQEYLNNKKEVDINCELCSLFLKAVKYGYIENSDFFSPFEYVYNQLKVYEHLQFITFKNITSSLSNCEIEFTEQDKKPILVFHFDFITVDWDEEKRNIYKSFINKIKNEKISDSEKIFLERICNILSNAGIKGILTDNENIGLILEAKCIYEIDQDEHNERKTSKLSFEIVVDSENQNIRVVSNRLNYELYALEKYDAAESYCNMLIRNCKRSKEYENLLIACFNRRFIEIEKRVSSDEAKRKFPDIKEFREEFNDLPIIERRALLHLLQVLAMSDLYNVLCDLRNDNPNCETIFKAKNLLQFVFYNDILLDRYTEFQEIAFLYFKLKFAWLERNEVLKNFFKDNNFEELCFLIRFFKTEKLKNLLNDFFEIGYELGVENFDYLINKALRNNLKVIKNNQLKYSTFDIFLENTYILLSNNKNTIEQQQKIIDSFLEALDFAKIRINIMNIISYFVVQQEKSNKKVNEKEINKVIQKLVSFLNIQRYKDFSLDYSIRLFNTLAFQIKDIQCFNDSTLLEETAKIILTLEKQQQLEVLNKFLFSLYYICTDECKSKLKDSYFTKANFNDFPALQSLDYYLKKYFLGIDADLNIEALKNIINSLNKIEEINRVYEYFSEYRQKPKNDNQHIIEEKELDNILEFAEKKLKNSSMII